jgi:hypothetical protein
MVFLLLDAGKQPWNPPRVPEQSDTSLINPGAAERLLEMSVIGQSPRELE